MKTATIQINGRDFTFRPDSAGDKGVIHQVFTRRDYDIRHMAQAAALHDWLGKQNKPPLIIDAGAHIGASAVWFAVHYPTAQIIAVEPEANNYNLLYQNTVDLGNVDAVWGAVGCYEGKGSLIDPGRDSWGFRVADPTHGAEPTVDVYPIWQLLHSTVAPTTPFIVKLDIEGGEDSLFITATDWLEVCPLVIVELHDWMLPGKAVSHNFLRAITHKTRFDIVPGGENLFCWNCDLLYP